MTTIRKFCFNDLLYFSSVNLDHHTMNGSMFHYQTLLTKWSNYCRVAVAPGNRIIAHIVAVTEDCLPGGDKGQVVTVSVDSTYRKMGLGRRLMRAFENQLSERVRSYTVHHYYYAFVYVPVINTPAIAFFGKIGYKITAALPNFYPKNKFEGGVKMSKVIG